MRRITGEEIVGALLDVKQGADVWGRADAILYRDLAKLGLVEITEAMNAPKDGAKKQPYFGCIITPAGRAALDSFKAWIRAKAKEVPV